MSAAPFVLFWHRHGNALPRVAEVAALRAPAALAGRPIEQGVELDLKWTRDGVLYAYHGPTGRELLTAAVAARRDGAALIDDLLARPGAASLRYLVELKRGVGDPGTALEAFARALEARGLADRVWIAASSLLLLRHAAERLPAAPRVLFADPPDAQGRVLHRPTTYVRESLRAFGLTAALPPGVVTHVCTIGLVARSPAVHARRAAAAQAHGLGYLPGRVTSRATLEALAAAGAPGAFVYADVDDL
jgi:glycerophosphoryl diester phosphodiesterase